MLCYDEQIALQFADEQLHDAVPVFRALRDRLSKEKELYVLADTTYGRCDAVPLSLRPLSG